MTLNIYQELYFPTSIYIYDIKDPTAINQEVEKRLAAQASQEDSEEVVEGVEETLEKAEAEEVSLPNNNCETAESEEDLRERFQKAFKDSVKIQF